LLLKISLARCGTALIFQKVPARKAGFFLEFIEFDYPSQPESVAKINSVIPRPVSGPERLVCISERNENICYVTVWSRPIHENKVTGLGFRISTPCIEALGVKDRKIIIVSAIHHVKPNLAFRARRALFSQSGYATLGHFHEVPLL
jgi:hypothetical protein